MPTKHVKRPSAALIRAGWLLCCMLLVTACHLDMYDQPKYLPYGKSEIFPDGSQSRPVPEGVVSRSANLNEVVTTGKEGEAFVAEIPVTVDESVVARGKERYNIYCVTCHGANADGKGLVASYFKPAPASFYLARLRQAPDGYIFNVITWGKGQMYGLASNITPEDRWAIIAYIRSLEQTPPEGVVTDPTVVPETTPRPAGTVQPNEPVLP